MGVGVAVEVYGIRTDKIAVGSSVRRGFRGYFDLPSIQATYRYIIARILRLFKMKSIICSFRWEKSVKFSMIMTEETPRQAAEGSNDRRVIAF